MFKSITIKGMAVSLLALGVLTGCGSSDEASSEDTAPDTEETSQESSSEGDASESSEEEVEEKEEENATNGKEVDSTKELKEVGQYVDNEDGKNELIAIAKETPITKENDVVKLELTGLKATKVTNISEEAKQGISLMSGNLDSDGNSTLEGDTFYFLSYIMNITNKADNPIESYGVKTAIVGNKQYDVMMDDMVSDDTLMDALQPGIEHTSEAMLIIDAEAIEQADSIKLNTNVPRDGESYTEIGQAETFEVQLNK